MSDATKSECPSLFYELDLPKFLKNKESPFLSIINGVLEFVTPILDTRISAIFPLYTLHNTGHSFRIMQYMSKLVEDYAKLSDLEIALLICAALLHDVGMGVSETDLKDIKSDNFAFCNTKYSAMLRLLNGNDTEATQEYIRRIHGQLSGRYIKLNLKDKLTVPGLPHLSLAEDLALICESHTRDYDWIKTKLRHHEVRGDYQFNSQYVACILRLADILDIDANRTPYRLYELISPQGSSEKEWKQHFDVLNNDKIVLNARTQLREIYFYGKSKNADIHRKLLTYIGWVETELSGALALVAGMKSEYNLPLDPKPKNEIETEGFSFSGYKMTLKFEAISSLLMGEKIYGSKQLGLRELIQNSLDACRIRQENEKRSLGEDPYVPTVRVVLDQESNVVTIKDNGVGMSMEIIKNHFLNIGVSYYQSFEFLLQDLSYKPIGNYGIGFLSCFMLSDEVTVKTRHYQAKDLHVIQLEKGNEWTSLSEKNEVGFFGTEVTLNYKQFLQVFDSNVEKIREFLCKFFLTDGINFQLLDNSKPVIPIKNELYPTTEPDKTFHRIDLGDYLNDIEGYVLVRKKTDFVRSLADLGLDESVYLYRPLAEENENETYSEYAARRDSWQCLVPANDLAAIPVDDYFSSSEIKYLSVPVVTKEIRKEFESGMTYTEGDTENVVEKLRSKLAWITILLPKNVKNYGYSEEVTSTDSILEGVDHAALVALGQEPDLPTYKFENKITLFEGNKNNLYLPFEIPEKRYFYTYSSNLPRQELFIRNVLIKDFYFTLPYAASVFDISTIVVNVNSRKFIPDISRNTIAAPSEQELNYVVGKAIHYGVIKFLGLGAEEVNTFQNFVARFYSRVSEFEKVPDSSI
ncbi:ATP-binding protein [Pedobacter cryoconitis]|uniref:HD-CE domain-containing protein n=1 Tax=Pedobacter cryoconitis TaxID=188932 RepID=A0A7X0JAN1_9SPHI|nr:ATP-binding protein [Pedobacter cryoconitis]MBB6502901.1 hypothetical protein [Pedobacter cryoconitis]